MSFGHLIFKLGILNFSSVLIIANVTAKLIKKGEIVIIIGFEITDKPVRSKTVIVNSDNKIEELIES